ncbi:MAG: hypothetical protein WCK98_03720 [bacterium]
MLIFSTTFFQSNLVAAVSIKSILFYIIMFFALCMGVLVFIACYNLLTKSMAPLNSLVILIPILVILVLTSSLAVINFYTFLDRVSASNNWIIEGIK